jgi:hypothetical protein
LGANTDSHSTQQTGVKTKQAALCEKGHSPFGQAPPSPFGQAPPSLFGQAPPSPFGQAQVGAFGSPQPGAFGAGGLGQPVAGSPFGAPAPQQQGGQGTTGKFAVTQKNQQSQGQFSGTIGYQSLSA